MVETSSAHWTRVVDFSGGLDAVEQRKFP
jgi:hypothetical protein